MYNDSNHTVGSDLYTNFSGDIPLTRRTSLKGDLMEILDRHAEESSGT